MLRVMVYLLGAYLIGSLPFDYWLAKIIKGVDIRQIGSGNPGATNLKRLLGWPGFITGFILDALKGAAPVLAGHWLVFPIWITTIAGLLAVSGHLFPVFLGFKGGKGVSTASGVFLVLNPLAIGIAFGVWLLAVITTRYVSLGSILAGVTVAGTQLAEKSAWSVDKWPISVLALLIFIAVLITHRKNIGRLLNGSERKF